MPDEQENEAHLTREVEWPWGWDPVPGIVLDWLDACATRARRGEA